MRGLAYVLALFAAVLTYASAAVAQERIALVIGNAAYEKSGWALRNPVNDASAIAEKLNTLGFDVVMATDADEEMLESAVRDFRRRLGGAGEDGVGLFYYSGHGVQADGVNWLIPTDFDGQVLQDVYGSGLRLGEVLSAMEDAGNGTNFVILDACRDDPLPRDTRSAGRGLAAEAKQTGLLIAYAAAPGQTAFDGGDEGLSPYTAAFVDLIDQPYPASSVFELIAGRVKEATGSQEPFVESGLRARSSAGFFYFSGPSGEGVVGPQSDQYTALTPRQPPSAVRSLTPKRPASTLTVSMSDVDLLVQSGGTTQGEERSVTYRMFPTVEFILSNQGKEHVVLTETKLVKSDDLEACVGESVVRQPFDGGPGKVPVAPGSIEVIAFEAGLPNIDKESSTGSTGFDLTGAESLWCVAATVFDQKGARTSSSFPAFTVNTAFTPPAEGENFPDIKIDKDVKFGARDFVVSMD